LRSFLDTDILYSITTCQSVPVTGDVEAPVTERMR